LFSLSTQRAGARPKTTPTNPHTQLDQLAPIELQDRLRDYALSLPGVRGGRSNVSVPGAVAFFLDDPPNPRSAPDLFDGEWGHIHPHYDGSLHLTLPTPVAEHLIELGWAEFHTVVASGMIPPVVVMLYGPRTEEELATAKLIIEEAYVSAGGLREDETGRPLGLQQTEQS
jgi:hypothetical protein